MIAIKHCRTSVFATFWLVCSVANAAGFYIGDIGSISLSRGGAVVASGTDLSAMWHNPANLSARSGLRLQLDVGLNVRTVDWRRQADPLVAPNGFVPVDNSRAAPTPIPAVFAAYDFGVPGLAVALGAYIPNNSLLKMPRSGPQRYAVIESGSFLLHVQAAVSYEPTPWLRVGAGLFATSVFFRQSMALNLGLSSNPEDPTTDVFIDMNGTQHLLLNANLGITFLPGAGFSIGASYLPARTARAKGSLKIEAPELFADSLKVTGSTAFLEIDLPHIVRLGVGWQYEDWLTLEVAGVYEAWSSVKDIRVEPVDIAFSLAPLVNDLRIGKLALQRGWRDAFSLRVGGEGLVYRPFDLRIRAGYFFESGAVPSSLVTVHSNDVDKHGLSLGLSAEVINHITVFAGYTRVFYHDQAITDSSVKVANPLLPTAGNTFGNGRYSFAHDIFSFSLAFSI